MYQSAINKSTIKTKRKMKWSIFWLQTILRLMSHSILCFLCSADLSKNFSQFIISIFIFSQYFFNRFCPVEKCGLDPHCLYHESWIYHEPVMKAQKKLRMILYFFCQKHFTSDFIFTEINIEVIQFTLYNSQTIFWIKSEVDMNYNNICIF